MSHQPVDPAVAEAVRAACVNAALTAYSEAGVSGLCHEGRWECAVDALRNVMLTDVSAPPPEVMDLARRFAFEWWANDRVLAGLAALSEVPAPALRWAAHVAGAQQVWCARLLGEPMTGLAVWPEWPLATITGTTATLRQRYTGLLERLISGEERLDRVVAYSTFTGVAMSTAVGDILTHLLLHGQYHRGQIASALRQAGHTPASTDFILWVREQSAAQ